MSHVRARGELMHMKNSDAGLGIGLHAGYMVALLPQGNSNFELLGFRAKADSRRPVGSSKPTTEIT
jgi:hypothetical protein